MSTQLPDPGALRCPVCSAEVPSDRDWCLECGHAARTRLAPPPSWRRPTAVLALVVAVAVVALVFAFVSLTDDDTPGPVGATGATGATVVPAPVGTSGALGTTGTATTTPVTPVAPAGATGGSATTTGQASEIAKKVAEAEARARELLGQGSGAKP